MAFTLDTARTVFLLLFHAAARRSLRKLLVAARAQWHQLEHGADHDACLAAGTEQNTPVHGHYFLHTRLAVRPLPPLRPVRGHYRAGSSFAA